jgi:hypothetical protein
LGPQHAASPPAERPRIVQGAHGPPRPLLAQQLRPAPKVDAKVVEQWIADLNSADYKVRQRASAELLKVGEASLRALDKALAARPPLEAQKRLEGLRDRFTSLVLADEKLRLFRAIEVLERIGTPRPAKSCSRWPKGPRAHSPPRRRMPR